MVQPRKSVLVVDMDATYRDALAAALRSEYRVLRVGTGEAALHVMAKEQVDLMLLAIELPGLTGIEVLKISRENYPTLEVIVLAGQQEIDAAIEVIRLGAFHYVAKDTSVGGVVPLVAAASEQQDSRRQGWSYGETSGDSGEREFIVGTSRSARDVMDVAERVAPLPATILILGESGTGKEMLARLIHRSSERRAGKFVAINLAAIPRELVESTLFGHEKGSFTGAVRQQIGKFEQAAGGTLFLDEIGDLRFDLQGKLLRALQENEIERVGGEHPIKTDFRLIVATNVDLEKAVRDGRFRGDLYYRLHIIPIRMPPLRARIEDLPQLAEAFLKRFNTKFRKNIVGIAESTMDTLSGYSWPGNIRELENVIERLVAVSSSDWITDEDLPDELQVARLERLTSSNLLEEAVTTFERNFIVRALQKEGWAVTATARALGIPLSTLKFKMDKLEIREIARKVRGH